MQIDNRPFGDHPDCRHSLLPWQGRRIIAGFARLAKRKMRPWADISTSNAVYNKHYRHASDYRFGSGCPRLLSLTHGGLGRNPRRPQIREERFDPLFAANLQDESGKTRGDTSGFQKRPVSARIRALFLNERGIARSFLIQIRSAGGPFVYF